jgi:hypothetical protein
MTKYQTNLTMISLISTFLCEACYKPASKVWHGWILCEQCHKEAEVKENV